MKVISIGRGPECNIVLNDLMISRHHAVLQVYPSGKYAIISLGANGTTVNGNPIVPNQPYPLRRGDTVIFATNSRLDWKKVPNPSLALKIGAVVGGVVALAVVAVLIVNFVRTDKDVYQEGSSFTENSTIVDSPEKSENNETVLPAENDTEVSAAEGKASVEAPKAFDDEDYIAAELSKTVNAKADKKDKTAKPNAKESKAKAQPKDTTKTAPAKKPADEVKEAMQPEKAPEKAPEAETPQVQTPSSENAPAPKQQAPKSNKRVIPRV